VTETVVKPGTVRSRRPAVALAVVLAALTWVAVIAITVPQAQSIGPQPNGDYGFFTGVAERLIAGDRLYVDIWDNKDPFVFYSIALARFFGIWGAWLLELLWIVAAAIAVWNIARWLEAPHALAIWASAGATPLLMVGLPYFMGSTHIPGIALTLVALAATIRDRPIVAGLVLAALTFFKLIMLPLGLAVLLVAIFTRRGTWTRIGVKQQLTWTLASFGMGLVATAVLLALRGELVPYLDAQLANILYSQTPIVPVQDPSLLRWIAQHVVTLVNPHVLAIVLTSGALLVWFAWAVRSDRTAREFSLWWIAGTAFVIEGLTVAAVSKWLHHALIFAVSSALIILLLAKGLARVKRGSGVLGVIALLIVTYPLMGVPSLSTYSNAVSSTGVNLREAEKTDRVTAVLQEMDPAPIAFIGAGNLVPRSLQLSDWPLACRHIAQRHFDSPRAFQETEECLPTAHVVVIAPDAEPRDGFPTYNAFLENARQQASRERSCTQVDGFIVCSRS